MATCGRAQNRDSHRVTGGCTKSDDGALGSILDAEIARDVDGRHAAGADLALDSVSVSECRAKTVGSGHEWRRTYREQIGWPVSHSCQS